MNATPAHPLVGRGIWRWNDVTQRSRRGMSEVRRGCTSVRDSFTGAPLQGGDRHAERRFSLLQTDDPVPAVRLTARLPRPAADRPHYGPLARYGAGGRASSPRRRGALDALWRWRASAPVRRTGADRGAR